MELTKRTLSSSTDNSSMQPLTAPHRDLATGGQRLLTEAFIGALRSLDNLDVYTDVDLSRHSRWRIGGLADCVACPHNAESLSKVIALANREQIPYVVIGLTTNLLLAQEGIRALVIHIGAHFAGLRIENGQVWCQAGYWVPRFAQKVARAGLTGGEHLAGIPGTLGGLICMNGGSQRKGIGDNLVWVEAVDKQGHIHRYAKDDCGFAYRTSIFQTNEQIITEAAFEFAPAADKTQVLRSMKRILEDRRRKFPQKLPNCGSVFVSNPAMYDRYGPPGAVIERCGLKGTLRGGAMISPLHANFIVNVGGASADDVLYLIDLVRTRVQQETGYDMDAEAKYVDSLGHCSPAHLIARQRFQEVNR